MTVTAAGVDVCKADGADALHAALQTGGKVTSLGSHPACRLTGVLCFMKRVL
jgi:hypothetical protein